jgi:hypothetical protein
VNGRQKYEFWEKCPYSPSFRPRLLGRWADGGADWVPIVLS